MPNAIAQKPNTFFKSLILVSSVLIIFFLAAIYFFPKSMLPKAASNMVQQASDVATSGKVKSAFNLSKRLSVYDIETSTLGGIVTLSGQVPSNIDKELAEKVARDTIGVQQVNNQLVIDPEVRPSEISLRESDRIADLEVQANLREKLAASPDLAGKPIQITVNKLAITLTGQVETPAQKSGAEQLARSLPNVTLVTNQLSVANLAAGQNEVPGMPAKDIEMQRQVEYGLFTARDDFADLNLLKVKCNDGIITLTGSVTTRAERSLAERIVRDVKGVAGILNQLQISG